MVLLSYTGTLAVLFNAHMVHNLSIFKLFIGIIYFSDTLFCSTEELSQILHNFLN